MILRLGSDRGTSPSWLNLLAIKSKQLRHPGISTKATIGSGAVESGIRRVVNLRLTHKSSRGGCTSALTYGREVDRTLDRGPQKSCSVIFKILHYVFCEGKRGDSLGMTCQRLHQSAMRRSLTVAPLAGLSG